MDRELTGPQPYPPEDLPQKHGKTYKAGQGTKYAARVQNVSAAGEFPTPTIHGHATLCMPQGIGNAKSLELSLYEKHPVK